MRDVMVRMVVLVALSAVVPLGVVGLVALRSPDGLEAIIEAAILSLVLLVAVHGGWAVRDGYHRWCGWWGPPLWAAIGATSPVGLVLAAIVGMGGDDDLLGLLRTYAVVAAISAGVTVSSWLVGRALPVGSFDVRDAPVPR